MAKLLVIESSRTLRKKYNELLKKNTDFKYDVVSSYKEAQNLLKQTRYEFGVTDINVDGAKEGVVISLMNRHNLAPIIFTDRVDEDFIETYESAQIASYILKDGEKNLDSVVKQLNQLQANKKSTLLVVDDSILYADFIKQNLILHKFKVLTASNGEQALEKLKNHPEIELVITSHRMKKMDGLVLTQKIRESRKSDELPILALTSNAEAASDFLGKGANDYLTKPFLRDEFYQSVYHNLNAKELL